MSEKQPMPISKLLQQLNICRQDGSIDHESVMNLFDDKQQNSQTTKQPNNKNDRLD